MPIDLLTFLLYLFLVVAGIQVVYWLFFFTGVLRLGKQKNTEAEKTEGISVVVAARDELHNLQHLIPALLAQNHDAYEIIIVNDRSADDTHAFLTGLEKQHEQLKALHIYEKPDHINAKKYALTLGIKAAQYKQVLLTDADCLPNSDSWVSHMAQGFSRGKDIVLGFSNYQKLPGLLNYFIRFETLLTAIEYLGAAANGLPYMGVGRNLAYKKDLFLENKGFFGYQHLVGGDDDLFVNKHSTARNTTIVTGKEAVTISVPKTSLSEFWQQKTRHLHAGKHYSFKSKTLLALFNLSWIFTWIFGISGLVFTDTWQIFATALVLRELLVIATFGLATKKLGIRFGIAGIIFVDILYVIYYIFAGTKALIKKTITWA